MPFVDIERLDLLAERGGGDTQPGCRPAQVLFLREGAGAATVRKSWTERMPRESGAGATTHPTRQPVTAYVFDRALIVTVRSSSPGTAPGGTCTAPS